MESNNFKNGQWFTLPSLDIARTHCPTASYNGKIYGFGGGAEDFRSLNSTIIFDPKTQSWSTGTYMPTLRSGAMAFTVGNKIYIVGGGFKQADGTFKFLRTTEIYYPDTDTWETGNDMNQPHDYPGGVQHDGYLYILAGHHPDSTTAGPKTDPGFPFCERMNIETGQWEEITSIPTPRFALDAVVIDNKIVTMGGVAFTPEGFNNFSHTEVYDPATNTWEQGEINLPWTAAGQGAVLSGGHLFIMGGYSGDGISNHAAAYNLETKNWHIIESMPVTLAAMGITTLDDSTYILGGWADDGRTPQTTVLEFRLAD